MPQEERELAAQIMDAISRRDEERLISLSDPEVEWHSLFASGREGGMYRGHDGTREYMRDLSDAWEIGVLAVDDDLLVGDVAVLVGRICFRGRGSGVESEIPAGWVLKFRDAKLLRFLAFRDPQATLAAVGRAK